MDNPVVHEASVIPASPHIVLGRERLLGVPEVREITGLGEVTAAKLMRETGKCLYLHRHLYVLESSFFIYLHALEVSEPCAL